MTDFSDFEQMLDVLKNKTIKTQNGTYIKVDDLKALIDERKQQEATTREEEAKQRTPKSFSEARVLAKQDPELRALFADKPQAPAAEA